MFILGLITGILVSILLLVGEIRFAPKTTKVLNQLKRTAEQKKGSVFIPDERSDNLQAILKRNAAEGEDTNLSDL